jgi:hypothetical protein
MKLTKYVAAAILAIGMASPVFAIPDLQLDINNGTYVGGSEESTITTQNLFTLQALLGVADGDLSRTYYISIALSPTTAQPGGSFGSIVFAGQTINVTADMTFGTPPVDSSLSDIGGHGVYETYYKEIAFTFDAGTKVPYYNVATGALQAGQEAYIKSFDVDISGLSSTKEVHFDLYATDSNGKRIFAPFSKDAGTSRNVPDGGSTLALVGLAIAGLGLARRKLS